MGRGGINAVHLLSFGALVLGGLGSMGCPDDVPPVGGPAITQFQAVPDAVVEGASASLVWVTEGATHIAIHDGDDMLVHEADGEVDGGQVEVSPATTTTYRLTAWVLDETGAVDEESLAEAEATVTVVDEPPEIVLFEADPEEVASGETVVLSWETIRATEVGLEVVGGDPLVVDDPPAAGTITVEPTEDTTYRLTAIGPGGTAAEEVTVRLRPGPMVRAFESSRPAPVLPGTEVVLSWDVARASVVHVHDETGAWVTTSESLEGSVAVSPSITTEYVLTAVGQGGETSAGRVVRVLPVIDSFEVSPPVVDVGEEVTVSWSTRGARELAITGPGMDPWLIEAGSVAEGSFSYVPGARGQLVATASSGSLEMQATAVVALRPAIQSFEADPAAVSPGGTTTLSWEVVEADVIRIRDGDLSLLLEEVALEDTGSFALALDQTTDFTLSVVNAHGEATLATGATVVPFATVDVFRALPDRVPPGGNVTLEWETTGAAWVRLMADGVDLGVDPTLTTGTFVHQQVEDTTYELEAYSPLDEVTTASAVVVVGVPEILAFEATPNLVRPGETTTLSWTVDGGITLTIDEDGDVVHSESDPGTVASGSVVLEPVADTVYTLRVVDEFETEASAEVAVVVTDGPIIHAFEATPPIATLGHEVTLSWTVENDGSDTTPVLLLQDGEGSPISIGSKNPNSDTLVLVADELGAHAYTLTAQTPGTRSDQAEASFTVVPPPVIGVFAADPEILDTEGGTLTPSATLSWEVQDATAFEIVDLADASTPIVSTEDPVEMASGAIDVTPAVTTRYRATAWNLAGTATSVEVVVGVDTPRVLVFELDPVEIVEGGETTLIWEVEGADDVVLHPTEADLSEASDGWVDISEMPGVQQLELTHYDTGYADLPFPDGFRFRLGEEGYDQVRVMSDGYLALGTTTANSTWSNPNLPWASADYGILSPFWDDLLEADDSGLYWIRTTLGGRDVVIVQWHRFGFWGISDIRMSFQVHLHRNGRFEFHYGPPVGSHSRLDGSGATIGYQDRSHDYVVQISRNSAIDGGLVDRGWRFDFPVADFGSQPFTVDRAYDFEIFAINENGMTQRTVRPQVWPDLATSGVVLSVNPTAIEIGEDATLSWSAPGATEVSILLDDEPVEGCTPDPADPTTGSCVVSPPVGVHTYVLEASNPASEITRQATLTVHPVLAIVEFFADEVFLEGPSADATVSWVVEGAVEMSLRIRDEEDEWYADLTGKSLESDSHTESVTGATEFRLRVEDLAGRVLTADVTVYLDAARIDDATVDTPQFAAGEDTTTTLSWDAVNADGVTIEPYVVAVEERFGTFVDLTASAGASELVLTSADEGHGDLDFETLGEPFVFPFDGVSHTELRILSNGYVSFDMGASSLWENKPIPRQALPVGGFIAPFWDDLTANGASTEVLYELREVTGGRALFIQWENWRVWGTTGELQFQLVLHENGDYEVRYGTMTGDDPERYAGGGASIGHENLNATAGHAISVNEPVPGGIAGKGWRVRFTHAASGSIEVSPERTTTYRLCATGGGYTDCRDVQVVVVQPGDVRFSEIMLAPSAGSAGQWLELRNVAPYPIDLAGWVLSDGENDFVVPGGVLGGGEVLVLGRSADTAENGGVAVDVAFGDDLSLPDDSGSLSLAYGDLDVSTLAWDVDDVSDPWTIPSGASLALDPLVAFPDATVPPSSAFCVSESA